VVKEAARMDELVVYRYNPWTELMFDLCDMKFEFDISL
jgi:hypothetical protein